MNDSLYSKLFFHSDKLAMVCFAKINKMPTCQDVYRWLNLHLLEPQYGTKMSFHHSHFSPMLCDGAYNYIQQARFCVAHLA